MRIFKVILVFLFYINFCNLLAQQKTVSDSLDILHYNINISFPDMGAKRIEGFAIITLTPKVDNLSVLTFDLLALTVDSVKINSNMPSFSQSGEKLFINLQQSLVVNDTLEVTIYYDGQPVMDNSGWGGFYFGSDSVSAFNLGVGFDAVPHNYGRVWFPCIDDFVDRATYDYRIRVKSPAMAVCGGELINVIDNGDNTRTYHWHLSTPIPTYIASVAVGNYAVVTDTYNGIERDIPIEIYVRPQDTLKVSGTFSNLKAALQTFEELFGAYRWQRVGYVGVSFDYGAMEHATNIAYPNACINGNLTYDDLMAHELSHHWFGNLYTCSTAEDMWLNEGWASFAEFVFFEKLYGIQYSKDIIRSIHKQVIQMAHVVDGDYWSLYGIPEELTYCRTVYDKGSIVAHNLRAYLGDSLFFNTMKAFIDSFAFNDVSSFQFRDFLTNYTQIDMTSFFENWVFTPGFPHFSADSLTIMDLGNSTFKADVFLKQKLNGRDMYSDYNIVEITFANENWHFETDTMLASGIYSQKSFFLNFNPTKVFVNFNEKSCFATTSYTSIIKQAGTISFAETHFSAIVNQVIDSTLLKVNHHWVAPDSLKINNPNIVRISDYRYWSIEGINVAGLKAKARFHYNRSTPSATSLSSNGWLDNTLFSVSADSLILLYREGPSYDWEIQSFSRIGNNVTGYITADTLKEGEYTLAIGVPLNNSTGKIFDDKKDGFKIIPNPSDSYFKILYQKDFEGVLTITDAKGSLYENVKVTKGSTEFVWTPNNLSFGTYFVTLTDKNKQSNSKKIIYQK